MITKPISNRTKYVYIVQSENDSVFNHPYFATDAKEASRLRDVKRSYYPKDRVIQRRIPLKLQV